MAGVISHIGYANLPPECVISGNVTFTHGLQPNVITITCAPFNVAGLAYRGDVVIKYGFRTIKIKDCQVSDVSSDTGGDGKTRFIVRLFDRRWRNRFEWLRGTWNYRLKENEVVPHRERSPHNLIKDAFLAMGEISGSWKLIHVPNDTRPFVEWDGVPATSLAALVEQLGCRVWLDPLTDRYVVAKWNVGGSLPVIGTEMTDAVTVDPPELPDALVCLCGKSIYQEDLELEAVGFEPAPAGQVQLLDDLSYAPSPDPLPAFGVNTWKWRDIVPPDFSTDRIIAIRRELAQQCVFRTWRIKTPFKLWWLPGQQVDSLDQILPLLTTQLQTQEVDNAPPIPPNPADVEVRERIPAILLGDFFGDEPQTVESAVGAQEWTAAGRKRVYRGGFSIDAERGLVTTTDYMFRLVDTNRKPFVVSPPVLDQKVDAAKLWLRTSFHLRSKKDWAFSRYKFEWTPPGTKTPKTKLWFERTDIQHEVWREFTATGPHDRRNTVKLEEQAKFYLEQEGAKLTWSNPGTRRYAGLEFVPLDGAIQQVTWEIDESGHSFTTVSRNRDPITYDLTYKEKLREGQLRDLLAKEAAAAGRGRK